MHFWPSYMTSSGLVKFQLDLEAPFMAPLGAPAQKPFWHSFSFPSSFTFPRWGVIARLCSGRVPVPMQTQQASCSSKEASESPLMGE